ncbi:hypothetical protein NFI96_016313 [Prochilodus magdalenae]|nr:hypothetical protein NFI96_016313 [Prochilodus magdalenae]
MWNGRGREKGFFFRLLRLATLLRNKLQTVLDVSVHPSTMHNSLNEALPLLLHKWPYLASLTLSPSSVASAPEELKELSLCPAGQLVVVFSSLKGFQLITRLVAPYYRTYQYPSRHTDNIPADTPTVSQQTFRQHPSRHPNSIPADTPTSQQTYQHPTRHTNNIPADTTTASQQTYQHPSRHPNNIPADTPTTSQQTYQQHPSRHTNNILADTPTTS